MQTAPSSIIERAKKILENSPQLVPKTKPSSHSGDSKSEIWASAGLEAWPEETNRAWKKAFSKEPPTSSSGTTITVGFIHQSIL
jgi:hypothetical protein